MSLTFTPFVTSRGITRINPHNLTAIVPPAPPDPNLPSVDKTQPKSVAKQKLKTPNDTKKVFARTNSVFRREYRRHYGKFPQIQQLPYPDIAQKQKDYRQRYKERKARAKFMLENFNFKEPRTATPKQIQRAKEARKTRKEDHRRSIMYRTNIPAHLLQANG